ncbi:MAG: RNA polymerase sigma factor [Candidatus Riflebacteria bacterium]|nr:RNA polymerase sigma factor [Candidatus Riflebacteria bacterium]
MEKTDKEVIERCLSGYTDDFRFLVRRYEKPLFAYLFCRLGNRSLAQEAAQESLVRAFTGLSKLNKPESFHSWLIGIAARVALEFHRSARRHVEKAETIAEVPVSNTGETQDYLLDEYIAMLPESQRQLILFRYYEELSCQQIADRLQVPLGTVTKTLSRAYVILREKLQSGCTTRLEGLA